MHCFGIVLVLVKVVIIFRLCPLLKPHRFQFFFLFPPGIPCRAKNYVKGPRKYIKKTSYLHGCLDVACESNSTFDEALLVAQASDYVILVVRLDLTKKLKIEIELVIICLVNRWNLCQWLLLSEKRPLILVLTSGGPLDVSFAKGGWVSK